MKFFTPLTLLLSAAISMPLVLSSAEYAYAEDSLKTAQDSQDNDSASDSNGEKSDKKDKDKKKAKIKPYKEVITDKFISKFRKINLAVNLSGKLKSLVFRPVKGPLVQIVPANMYILNVSGMKSFYAPATIP